MGTNLESGFASAFVPHLWVTDAAGCKETMPLAVQFWRDRYGQVVALFGLRWAIATHIEEVSPPRDAQAHVATFQQEARLLLATAAAPARYARSMSRLSGVKQNVGGGGAGFVDGRGAGISLADLNEEERRAYEIVQALKLVNETEVLKKLFERAGAQEQRPGAIDVRTLMNIAQLYDELGMPLSSVGLARFKQERGLLGGTITGQIAKAYVRALEGHEILVLVSKAEESALRPSEKACLGFLRELAKKSDASLLRAVKKPLSLGNPPAATNAAAELDNEYVGVQTVKDLAQATTLRRISLTKDGLRALAEALARDGKTAQR